MHVLLYYMIIQDDDECDDDDEYDGGASLQGPTDITQNGINAYICMYIAR